MLTHSKEANSTKMSTSHDKECVERDHESNHWSIVGQPYASCPNRKNVAMTAFIYIVLMSVRLGNVGLAWQQKYRSSLINANETGETMLSRKLSDFAVRPDNKTLVVLIGSVRGGSEAWDSLYRNMLDPNMADMALVVGWDDDAHEASSLFKHAKYVVQFPEYNNWSESMDVMERWLNGGKKPSGKNRKTWRDIALRQGNGLFGATREDPLGSGGIQNFARWLVSATINELGLLDKYDRFIVTRTDNYYKCETDLRHLDLDSIWVPVGVDYGGIGDRMIMSNSQNVERVMDIIPSVVHNPKSYVCVEEPHEPCGGNIERVYEARLRENVSDIRRFERTMFIVKTVDDLTRSGKIQGTTTDGLYYKYYFEYEDANLVCGREDAARNSYSESSPKIAEMTEDEYYEQLFKRHPKEKGRKRKSTVVHRKPHKN